MKFILTIGLVLAAMSFSSLVLAAEEAVVEDNSFLIEEAYNQEAGVVQFIQGYQYSDLTKDWAYTFTNEIPVPDETHQFSYVLPMLKKTGLTGAADETGLGDILLNYRFQAVKTETLAMAPRISFILPTGDSKKGLGSGATGIQFNQSFSVVLSPKFSNHWNAGFTYTPNAKNSAGDKASLVGFNFGSSVVFNATPKTNLLCEFVFNNNESVAGPDQKSSASTYFIVPGVRSAFAVGKDTEVVPGVAAVLGFGPSAIQHDRGIFFYLSVESKLW